MALPGKTLDSAVFGSFRPPIWPCDFRTVFEGVVPVGEEIPPPSKGGRVPKTEELGTAGYQPDICRFQKTIAVAIEQYQRIAKVL
jgi:hypothetical protein